MTVATKQPTKRITKAWRKILLGIPGYDSIATAKDAWFEPDAAQEPIDFIETCCVHIEGALAGQPFLLAPWQKSIIANLFGWKWIDEFKRTVRRYREALLFVGRKNGKTPFVAAIANYVFFVDDEAGQQNYLAASTAEQASLAFRHVSGMIEAESRMASRARIYRSFKSVVNLADAQSFIKVLAGDEKKDAKAKHGGNPHLVIVDELHAQPTPDLVEALATSFASANRAQPLFIQATTSDYERPSICNRKHEYACKVRDGIIKNPRFLPVIYEANRDDDWTKLRTWRKANPNLGVSVSLEYLRQACKDAQAQPEYENTFKRLHLNIRTEQATRWIVMSEWDACAGAIDPDELKGHDCWVGIDLAQKIDIAAAVLFCPDAGNALIPFFWLPRDSAGEREHRDQVPYLTWARQGFIELTPGNTIDYAFIRERVNELAKEYNLVDIGYDPYDASHFAQELQDEDGITMVEFRQGFISMNEPAKQLQTLLRSGQLRHGGNPVLRWMASNVVVRVDSSDNIRFDKAKSSEKIDGIVAATMAIGRALQAEKGTASEYDKPGSAGVIWG